jgi:multiple sugar transport system substrate-binding protein
MNAAIAQGISRRAAIAGMGALLGTAACSRGSSSDPVSFWAIGREGEMAAKLIEQFTQLNPGIAVEVQKLPWSAAHEKLLTAYAGDTLPDLCQLGSTWLAEFAALDALEPLDAFVARSGSIELEDYFPGILEANRIDGQLLGLPWYVDTRLLFYRRDLLQQAGFSSPPTTWEEWRQMLAAIKSMVGNERYAVLLPLNEFEPLLILALQQPDELLRDGGRFGNFRSEGFRRALRYYEQMFAREWAPRMTNTQISNVWDEFARGYYSFYVSGPWQITEFKRRLPAHLQDSWMTAPMPGPSGPGVSVAGGASLVLFRGSQRKPAAWRLAEFMSSVATQTRFYELTGDLPTRRSVWTLPALVQSPYARAFRQQLDCLRAPPKVPEWERIATELRLMAERVVQGASTVDAAVVALDAKADAILEKRRWLLDRRSQA